MGKQRLNRITKMLSVLLLVFFVMFLTAASESAKNVSGSSRDYKIGSQPNAQDGHNVGYGTRDYQMGFQAGTPKTATNRLRRLSQTW
jgi:hypothetical protein